jgi:hypothetical protein
MMFTKFFPIVSIWEVQEGRELAIPEVVERVQSYMPGRVAPEPVAESLTLTR